MRTFALSLILLAATAAPALAKPNGEGLAGETDDKVVTFFSLGVVVFFTLVVILGSVAQHLLDKRKQEQKAAKLRQREGW